MEWSYRNEWRLIISLATDRWRATRISLRPLTELRSSVVGRVALIRCWPLLLTMFFPETCPRLLYTDLTSICRFTATISLNFLTQNEAVYFTTFYTDFATKLTVLTCHSRLLLLPSFGWLIIAITYYNCSFNLNTLKIYINTKTILVKNNKLFSKRNKTILIYKIKCICLPIFF